MQDIEAQSLPRRLIGRLMDAPAHLRAGFLPALKAYGGFKHDGRVIPADETLGRLGTLEVRLARNASEVRRAQRLRYRVFYKEGSAVADATTRLSRRDIDSFDSICDHLLVIDHAHDDGKNGPNVVGTYRLLPQDIAQRHGGFYTAAEFDIGALVAGHPSLRFLELGRSCVLPQYRNKRTVELLWHGCWSYVLRNRLDVMIGCASLEGTDPDALATPLSFLHHFARAPQEWRAHALPPLIKGYLRLGAYIGEGAVIDRQFRTTDVLIILPVSALNARYIDHFGAGADRHAA